MGVRQTGPALAWNCSLDWDSPGGQDPQDLTLGKAALDQDGAPSLPAETVTCILFHK